MGNSRPGLISTSANQIREFGSSQSLLDRAYNKYMGGPYSEIL